MKKLLFIFAFIFAAGTTTAMVRAGVDLGPDGYYYPYDNYWYGPGWYYGTYYYDYPAYSSWRNRYWGGPYYWRHHHHHRYWK